MSPVPTIEIFSFVASDAYKADPSIFDPAIETILKTPGCQGFYIGFDAEHSDNVWMVVVWESLQHHRDLMADKDVYPALTALLGKASSKVEPDALHHVEAFSGDIFAALNAPFTEFAVWDRNADVDKAVFHANVKTLVDKFDELAPQAMHKGGWGEPVENEKRVFVCLGWDSVEEHMNFVPSSEALMGIIGKMSSLGTFKLFHAQLKKHELK